jgi:integrase
VSVVNPEQFERLYSAIQKRWQMLVEIGIETGIRWGELAELRVSDFNPDRRTITIARAVAENSTKATGASTRYVIKDYPKSREHRAVGLSREVATRFTSHIGDNSLGTEALLFSSVDGGHISRSNFRARV